MPACFACTRIWCVLPVIGFTRRRAALTASRNKGMRLFLMERAQEPSKALGRTWEIHSLPQ